MKPVYIYKADLDRVVDGDTIIVLIDLGFDVQIRVRVRLLGVNSPDISTLSGKAAKARLIEIFSNSKRMILDIIKRDRYGRWIGKVWLMMSGNQICLNDLLADEYKKLGQKNQKGTDQNKGD